MARVLAIMSMVRTTASSKGMSTSAAARCRSMTEMNPFCPTSMARNISRSFIPEVLSMCTRFWKRRASASERKRHTLSLVVLVPRPSRMVATRSQEWELDGKRLMNLCE